MFDDLVVGEHADDDAVDVLVVAMAEFAGEFVDDPSNEVLAAVWNPSLHARYPKGHPLAGKFRPMVDRLVEALKKHAASGGKGDPFAGFSREQLRRAAVTRGLTLKRNASQDEISKALLDDLPVDVTSRPKKADTQAVKRVPRKAAPKKAGTNRDLSRDRKAIDAAFQAGQQDGEWQAPGAGVGGQFGGRFDPSKGGYQAHLELAHRQGFDALPRIVSDPAEFSRLEEAGWTRLHRGWGWGTAGTDRTGEDMAAQYLYGDLHVGGGLGLGTNMSDDLAAASYYEGGDLLESNPDGRTVGFLLSPDAKVIKYPDAVRMRDEYLASLPAGAKHDAERRVFEDAGTFAMAKGYDAMVATRDDAKIVKSDTEEWVIFNRGALVAFDQNDHGAADFARVQAGAQGIGLLREAEGNGYLFANNGRSKAAVKQRTERLDRLVAAGHLRKDGGTYRITDAGRAYLDGDTPALAGQRKGYLVDRLAGTWPEMRVDTKPDAPAAPPAPKRASGKAALDAAPVSLLSNLERHRDAKPPTATESAAFDAYGSNGQAINARLRRGGRITAPIAQMDAAMARSPLSGDVELWRGVSGGSDLPGLDLSGDVTGAEFTDRAFVSTSVDRQVAERFAQLPGSGPKVVLRVSAPQGTGAVAFSSSGGISESQGEMLLARGLTFHVTADHGTVDGLRHLDVEVVPTHALATPAKKATKRAPAAPTADPTGAGGLSDDPAVREAQIENRIRVAYADVLAGRSNPGNRWVGLADLRAEMGDGVDRREVDAALKRLEQADGVNVVPESNQKTLTQADRDAAVVIGDQQKHAITMDDPSPRPLPAATPTKKAAPRRAPARKAAPKADGGQGPPELAAHLDSINNVPATAGRDARASVAEALTRQAELAPRSMSILQGVSLRPGASLFGTADVQHSDAKFNPASLTIDLNSQVAEGGFAQTQGKQRRRGVFVPGGPDEVQNLVSHEVGHHIATIIQPSPGRWLPGSRDELFVPLADELGVDPPASETDINNWLDQRNVQAALKSHLSEYAAKNQFELLAEIWAEYTTRGDRARAVASRIGPVLAAMAEGTFASPPVVASAN